MRNIILAFAIILLTAVASVAQCDKKVKWQAAKAEMLDESGTVIDTKEGGIVVVADSKSIVLEIVENFEDKLEGTVTDLTCDWKEAFKNGKSSFKSTLTLQNGETTGATFDIEGKDGKLIILMKMERMNGKSVRILVDKYEVI